MVSIHHIKLYLEQKPSDTFSRRRDRILKRLRRRMDKDGLIVTQTIKQELPRQAIEIIDLVETDVLYLNISATCHPEAITCPLPRTAW